MLQEVDKIFYELRIVIRVRLKCGHLYTRDLTGKEGIKRKYICHACLHKMQRNRKNSIETGANSEISSEMQGV